MFLNEPVDGTAKRLAEPAEIESERRRADFHPFFVGDTYARAYAPVFHEPFIIKPADIPERYNRLGFHLPEGNPVSGERRGFAFVNGDCYQAVRAGFPAGGFDLLRPHGETVAVLKISETGYNPAIKSCFAGRHERSYMPGGIKNSPGADYKREPGQGEKGGQKPESRRHAGKKNRGDGKNGQHGNPEGRNTRDPAKKDA
jgi:hypothetical protein